MHCFVAFLLVLVLIGKRELIALLCLSSLSCDCYCSVALPRGAVGWSVMCDYGIS